MPELPVYRRGEIVAYALVDEADYERFKGYRWRPLSTLGYPSTNIDGRPHSLHRLVIGLQPGDGLECDHVNRNPLDNRRSNLRLVSHRENCANRGGMYEPDARRGWLTVVDPAQAADEHREVVQLAASGLSVRQIAAKVGTSKSTIHRIVAAYRVCPSR